MSEVNKCFIAQKLASGYTLQREVQNSMNDSHVFEEGPAVEEKVEISADHLARHRDLHPDVFAASYEAQPQREITEVFTFTNLTSVPNRGCSALRLVCRS